MNRPLWLLSGAVTVLLAAFATGYGYHRDELYFIVAGHHLAWAYADQGVLTPLIARATSELAPGSLLVLRLPSALAAGATVLLTGLLARELGGSRRAQVVAAACAAVSGIVLVTGHWLSTSTFDLLVWTATTFLVVRAVRTGDDRLWLAAGVVLGVGLMNQPLPAFLVVGLLAGVAITGPRRLLRNPYVWAGGIVALALWSPWIAWQASHGWPQIDVSRAISGGGSTSSQPWWAVVPFQVLLVSPPLAPVWIAGLVSLFRAPALRDLRFLAWAWVVLALVFMATGGKPYYLSGLLPVLIAAGAIQADAWLSRGRAQVRRRVLVVAIVAAGLVGSVIALPILPTGDLGPVLAVNPDVGETIGWRDLVRTVAVVDRTLPVPRHAVILTSNYGEAGAIDRFGPALGLPPAYSGHNAFWDWGPPPGSAAPVIAVGMDPAVAAARLRGCRVVARIGNRAGVDNDERGEPVQVCAGPRRPWAAEWGALRSLG
ncbi:MAG TPA: glycosyltransferase family 39 protein [Solirubrobacteraceae bacterium]